MRSMLSRLRLLVAASALGLLPGGRAAVAADADEAAWNTARSAGTVAAYQGYLDQFPIGRFASDAFVCIVGLTDVPELAGACRVTTATTGPAAPGTAPGGAAGVAAGSLAGRASEGAAPPLAAGTAAGVVAGQGLARGTSPEDTVAGPGRPAFTGQTGATRAGLY